jgi:hypothetical protein
MSLIAQGASAVGSARLAALTQLLLRFFGSLTRHQSASSRRLCGWFVARVPSIRRSYLRFLACVIRVVTGDFEEFSPVERVVFSVTY